MSRTGFPSEALCEGSSFRRPASDSSRCPLICNASFQSPYPRGIHSKTPATANNTKPYVHAVFFYTYIPRIKLNLYIRYIKRMPELPASPLLCFGVIIKSNKGSLNSSTEIPERVDLITKMAVK